MSGMSTIKQALTRYETHIEKLTDPRHKAQLRMFLDHIVAETRKDLDAVMKTMSDGPIRYRRDGSSSMQIADMSAISNKQDVHDLYQRVIDAGGTLAGPTDNERFYFGDHGLIEKFVSSGIFSGSYLTNYDPEVDQSAHYLVRSPMILAITFDEEGLINGEEGFSGAPILVQKVDPALAGLLVDGPLPHEWTNPATPTGRHCLYALGAEGSLDG